MTRHRGVVDVAPSTGCSGDGVKVTTSLHITTDLGGGMKLLFLAAIVYPS